MKRTPLEESRTTVDALFVSANEDVAGIPDLPTVSSGFQRIVETTFDIDILALYSELEGQLTIANALTPEAIRTSLNKCEDNARKAHQIFVAAKFEFEKLKLEYSKVESAMRNAAVRELVSDKASGLFTKQITEADTAAKVVEMFPDEVVALTSRRVKEAETLEHLRRLSDLWQQRGRTLVSLNNY